jgi:hypothetical protein
MKRAWLLVALLAPLSCAVAQETTENRRLPEELAITRSVVMQEADELESTASFNYFKLPDQKRITTAAEFEYGLTDRWELDAGVPYEFVNPNDARSADGIGDVEAAVRYGVSFRAANNRSHSMSALGSVSRQAIARTISAKDALHWSRPSRRARGSDGSTRSLTAAGRAPSRTVVMLRATNLNTMLRSSTRSTVGFLQSKATARQPTKPPRIT